MLAKSEPNDILYAASLICPIHILHERLSLMAPSTKVVSGRCRIKPAYTRLLLPVTISAPNRWAVSVNVFFSAIFENAINSSNRRKIGLKSSSSKPILCKSFSRKRTCSSVSRITLAISFSLVAYTTDLFCKNILISSSFFGSQ